jgi:hypothetical protein
MSKKPKHTVVDYGIVRMPGDGLPVVGKERMRREIESLKKQLATARAAGYEQAREQAAKRLETRDVVLPLDDWRGTKKDFGAKLARALAADIRAMQPEVTP